MFYQASVRLLLKKKKRRYLHQAELRAPSASLFLQYLGCLMQDFPCQQADISRCVVKKDLAPEHHWLSSSVESLKYFLSTVYVYIMKEA